MAGAATLATSCDYRTRVTRGFRLGAHDASRGAEILPRRALSPCCSSSPCPVSSICATPASPSMLPRRLRAFSSRRASRRANPATSPHPSPRSTALRGRAIGRWRRSGWPRSVSTRGEAYWLAADPVTQVVGRDDVLVTGAVGDLGEAGANALIETLDAHFATDGLRFIAPRPDTFFVRAPTRPQLATQPLAAASGR